MIAFKGTVDGKQNNEESQVEVGRMVRVSREENQTNGTAGKVTKEGPENKERMETQRGGKNYHIKVHMCIFCACAPIHTHCVCGTNLDNNFSVARSHSPLISAQLHSVLGFSP